MKILLNKVFGPSFEKIRKIGKMEKSFLAVCAQYVEILTKIGFACMVGPTLSKKSYCESKNVVGEI